MLTPGCRLFPAARVAQPDTHADRTWDLGRLLFYPQGVSVCSLWLRLHGTLLTLLAKSSCRSVGRDCSTGPDAGIRPVDGV